MDQKLFDVGLVSMTIGVAIAAAISYIPQLQWLKPMAPLIAGFIGFGPIVILQYERYRLIKDVHKNFPIFLTDVAENVRAGMTLVKAVKMLENKNYGKMTPYVRKIARQVDWGISFGEVMDSFAREINDPLVTRTVKTLIETHRYGGKIEDVLTAVVQSVLTIENIRKEREATIFSQVVNGYVIYVLFVVIMVIMTRFLAPMMSSAPGTSVDPAKMKSMFRSLLIIQSMFSGLIIGKMSEGLISAGFKHVLIMFVIGYMASFLF